jgi:hypothetical protein
MIKLKKVSLKGALGVAQVSNLSGGCVELSGTWNEQVRQSRIPDRNTISYLRKKMPEKCSIKHIHVKRKKALLVAAKCKFVQCTSIACQKIIP